MSKLTVTNAYGIKASTEYTVSSVPRQKLWVEMFWDVANDDMDLHLVRNPEKVAATLKKKEKKKLALSERVDVEQTCFCGNCIPDRKNKPLGGVQGMMTIRSGPG